MRIWRMTSLVSAAPGGASMPGTEIAGPPGCANGTGGRSNRSRSRPGWSLGGTICAPGGTTGATAANETLTIAKAAAMARTPASMPPDPSKNRPEFYVWGRVGAIVGRRCQRPRFGNFSRCFNKVTPAARLRRPQRGPARKRRGVYRPHAEGAAKGAYRSMNGRAASTRRDAAWHPLLADQAPVVGKGGAGEARRPEGRGWIVREAVALLGLAEQARLHLRLVALGVENGDRIGPRRDAAEHAGRVSILDRRDRAAHFAARLAETVGGGIEPAAHGPAVVAHAGDGHAQFSRRLRARPGCKREHEGEGEKRRPHRISPVVARHLALSKAMLKPSSGRLISIGFLLAS